MPNFPQRNWQSKFCKAYSLKWYIISLILNCKALHPMKDVQLLCTASNGGTGIKLKTLAVGMLCP